MTVWQFCICAGLAFLILELMLPFTFFLSLAIGAFLTSVVAVWIVSKSVLIPTFAVLSIFSLIVFRPFLAKAKNNNKKENETGIEGLYIGKTAKVIKTINKNEGAISIYGERWEARCIDEEEIPEGAEVEIVKNESLVMYVKKVNKEN
ncbi:MAG: NfeD family protein [Candidatus Gastranaerophilaceae bacterium]